MANTPAPDGGCDPKANLLNLLKFNQNTQTSPHPTFTSQNPSSNAEDVQVRQGRQISADDLVASFMRKPSSVAVQSPRTVSLSQSQRPVPSSSTDNPQDLLLKLLNQSQGKSPRSLSRQNDSYTDSIEAASSEATVDDVSRHPLQAPSENTSSKPSEHEGKESPMRVFGISDDTQSKHFQSPQPHSKSSMFTAVNPFEQLAASSPRIRTPIAENRSRPNTPKVDILKHGREDSTGSRGGDQPQNFESSRPAIKTRKLSSTGDSKVPKVASRPEAPVETVSEALGEVGEQVNKQVEEALAQADLNGHSKSANNISEQTAYEMEQAIHDTAVEMKHEIEENPKALEEVMPKPMVDAIKDVVDEVARADIADSWESADAEDSPAKGDEFIVRVFSIPLRPFVSITINKLVDPPVPIRSSAVMDIARLKKEFDQIDRTLVAATPNLISYALPKSGGFRLIRQDDGKYRQVYNKSKERIFNVAVCSAPDNTPEHAHVETFIGTGIQGSVFWVPIYKAEKDFVEDLEEKGLIFPPPTNSGDQTSGGQLKTRVKPSSRHPAYFALGRGKSIHIVWPRSAGHSRYTEQESRIVNSEKYLKEHRLVVNTGKAGKDFAFSACDSVIATLDKTGKLRFWDIRDLTEPRLEEETDIHEAVEINDAIYELQTTIPGEKSWPTSVMFLDKEIPMMRGTASRYLIVGMKQNHTLQLWDIGLGKAVQEINFPHDKESDAICSITYHPKTGIIAVGHPTRNSIYFVHLSAPRYNLPAMAAAKYIQRVADGDSRLPRPESTAIMSGVREISFAPKGDLRSLEILSQPAGTSIYDGEDSPLFELYVMHSKGVTCLSIRKEDLGWDKDGKVLHSVDAASIDGIDVGPIRAPPPTPSELSVKEEYIPQSSLARPSVKLAGKKDSTSSRAQSQTPESSMIASTLARVESKQDAARAILSNSEKTEKSEKKKKRAGAADTASQISNALSRKTPGAPATNPPLVTPASYAHAAQRAASPAPPPTSSAVEDIRPLKADPMEVPTWASRLFAQAPSPKATDGSIAGVEKLLKEMEKRLSSDIVAAFQSKLDGLYKKIDEDRRVQEAAGSAKQEAILRLVSSTLTENVEKTLSKIVQTNLSEVIVPSLNQAIITSVEHKITETLGKSIQNTIPREIKAALPQSVGKALQEADVLRLVSELVSGRVAQQVENQMTMTLHNTITPNFTNHAVKAAQQIAGEVERRVGEQLRQTEIQHRNDNAKIDQLTNLVHGLTSTVQTMAQAQANFQAEILKLQTQLTKNREESTKSAAAPAPRAASPPPVKSVEDEELETITRHISEGNYEDGTIMVNTSGLLRLLWVDLTDCMQWLQSPRQAELFDNLFVRCNPAYIAQLNPLVALSVSAAVTASLTSHIEERLAWLEASLNNVDPTVSPPGLFNPKNIVSIQILSRWLTLWTASRCRRSGT